MQTECDFIYEGVNHLPWAKRYDYRIRDCRLAEKIGERIASGDVTPGYDDNGEEDGTDSFCFVVADPETGKRYDVSGTYVWDDEGYTKISIELIDEDKVRPARDYKVHMDDENGDGSDWDTFMVAAGTAAEQDDAAWEKATELAKAWGAGSGLPAEERAEDGADDDTGPINVRFYIEDEDFSWESEPRIVYH